MAQKGVPSSKKVSLDQYHSQKKLPFLDAFPVSSSSIIFSDCSISLSRKFSKKSKHFLNYFENENINYL
jgi:accessory colonization factor AcfC